MIGIVAVDVIAIVGSRKLHTQTIIAGHGYLVEMPDDCMGYLQQDVEQLELATFHLIIIARDTNRYTGTRQSH